MEEVFDSGDEAVEAESIDEALADVTDEDVLDAFDAVEAEDEKDSSPVDAVVSAAQALVAASEENVSINYDAALAKLKAALEPFED